MGVVLLVKVTIVKRGCVHFTVARLLVKIGFLLVNLLVKPALLVKSIGKGGITRTGAIFTSKATIEV